MGAMSSGDESESKHMFTDMLEDIRDRSQYNPRINRIEARNKIRDRRKQESGMKG